MFDDQPTATATAPRAERDAEIIRLALASPMRPTSSQRAIDDLPMFEAAAEPNLI